MYDTEDTIAAIATAAGGAARGMIRLSGPQSVNVVAKCFTADDGRPLHDCQRATAIPGQLEIDISGGVALDSRPVTLDSSLFLWPGPRSYTRQPLAELHTIGSPPLLEAALAALCHAGARLAEPGEFTLRAFLAGRLDLTQAEAVLGVIDAHTATELKLALTQLAGGLAGPLSQLREDMLQLLAELEAGLDFVDEDIQFVSPQIVTERLTVAGRLLSDVANQMAGRLNADRFDRVVLVGPPNAGKSSLFNALKAFCAANWKTTEPAAAAALVSPARGTTRDYLTAPLFIGGVSCELIDTAGVETTAQKDPTGNRIDSAAQAIAADQGERAAIRLLCVDASSWASTPDISKMPNRLDRDLVVITKADAALQVFQMASTRFGIETSSHTGRGLGELCEKLRELLSEGARQENASIMATTADRCRESIRLAGAAIDRAIGIVADDGGDELIAAELRLALDELGKVVGAIYTDDLLDRIFSTFCIGK